MADQIELLKQLQVIDGELYRLRDQLEQLPRAIEDVAARVAAQDAQVKAAEQRLKTLQLAQKEKEIDLQTREASVKKLQGQLFQVKTNKEYSAMQREIDSLKTDNSLLEEAILKTFDAIEAAAKEKKDAQAVFARVQEEAKVEQRRLEQEGEALKGQISQRERERQLLRPDVPRETLAVYERVLDIREGLAMVPLVNESCGGCHRRLPPQVINQVHLKAALVTCEHCNRILYLNDAHSQL